VSGVSFVDLSESKFCDKNKRRPHCSTFITVLLFSGPPDVTNIVEVMPLNKQITNQLINVSVKTRNFILTALEQGGMLQAVGFLVDRYDLDLYILLAKSWEIRSMKYMGV
jgi:hypothetical protein